MKETRVYMDGVFDLFHVGHVESIKQTREFGTTIIIGVVSDEDAISYKRKPIIPQEHRCKMIKQCKYVDEIIFPCPLFVTKQFLNDHNIDVVVHGFKDEEDYKKQEDFFKDINLVVTKYNNIETTTDIINRIINR
jgi:cytidyltransferase-like protein